MRGPTATPPGMRQRGVVLTVTLLMLLLVTIAGLNGMDASTLQVHLSRNARLKYESFQNAESALLTGETEWDRKLAKGVDDVAGCTLDIYPPMLDRIDWSSLSGDGVNPYGKHAVEFLGERPLAGDESIRLLFYRVSALGESPDGQSRTVLQSIFRRCIRSDGSTCQPQEVQ